MRIFLLFIGLLGSISLLGQALDQSKIFTLDAYMEWVRSHHPVSRQAALLSSQAEAAMRMARGHFDPKLSSDMSQKSFDEKTYFTLIENELKIPSWFGMEFKAAYDWTNGVFLNPENNLPTSGQAVAGLKWSVLQGLVIDERRAALKQARILRQANEAERRRLVNELMNEAAKAYWSWAFAFRVLNIYDEAFALAEVRLEGIRQSFLQGDKPAIDTLEAFIQVQDRQLLVNQAQLSYQEAGLKLSNFLWSTSNEPLEIRPTLRPEGLRETPFAPPTPLITDNWSSLLSQHPDLLKYDFKQSQLRIDRRLAVEQLKPRLDLEYNFLADGLNFNNKPSNNGDSPLLQNLITNNYKWGIQFSVPILLRKERGKLQMVDIKIAENDLKRRNKRQELSNKLSTYQQQLNTTGDQITLYERMVVNYRDLLAAENEKFKIGESSLFLINSREQKLIDARLKLLKFQADYRKLQAGALWAAGVL